MSADGVSTGVPGVEVLRVGHGEHDWLRALLEQRWGGQLIVRRGGSRASWPLSGERTLMGAYRADGVQPGRAARGRR